MSAVAQAEANVCIVQIIRRTHTYVVDGGAAALEELQVAVETLELAGTGKLVYFMAIDEAKFRNPVEPGVLLDLNVGFVQKRSRVCKFWGKASIQGKPTCEVNFTAMVADPPQA